MMGWMHDTLGYLETDTVFRKYRQGQLTFSMMYAFSEKFMLPLSHDEVVYGKGSLINKMPGDHWQQFANLRLLYGYMFGHPGAKMIFMGSEFAQRHEWQHHGVQRIVRDLNKLYQEEPALYLQNFSSEGFEWINADDADKSVISWIRKGLTEKDNLIFVANFSPVAWQNYRIGVPTLGFYEEIFNTDNLYYGGSNVMNSTALETANHHGHSLSLKLPPLGMIILKHTHTYGWYKHEAKQTIW
jgi:1,4-alpha-glucan branching enzyme